MLVLVNVHYCISIKNMYMINYMKFIQDENAEEESKEEEPKPAEEESWEESFHEHKDSRPKGF